MIQQAAPTSTAIKVITGLIGCLALFFIFLGLSQPVMQLAALLMVILMFACYLYAPVGYEIKDQTLIIHLRIKKKVLGQVRSCSVPEGNFPKSIRTWGNGGLFSASGFFWNRSWGKFRADVTNLKNPYLLLVETEKIKVLISPVRPRQFEEFLNPKD